MKSKLNSEEAEIRTLLEERELQWLSSAACPSRGADKRRTPELPCPLRTAFQVDRDRILQSKAFRRLKYKTQVFLSPEGDHYRTRLTHTLEVAQISRTVARALGLNEDLTEAISLGHDLGHTPFGHAGERVLNRLLPEGFRHVQQSVRVVEKLENDGNGLNLTAAVIDGIALHSKGNGPLLSVAKSSLPKTLEGQVVRLSDIIAYVNHDLDDAIRAGLVREDDIPTEVKELFSGIETDRLRFWIADLIHSNIEGGGEKILLSDPADQAVVTLRDWLYRHVYRADEVHVEFEKADRILEELFHFFMKQPEEIVTHGGVLDGNEVVEICVADFLAGMTDRYALNLFRRLFLPTPWKVL